MPASNVAGHQAALDALFDAALDVPTADRAAWLADRCAGDSALHDEVAALLAAHDRTGGILDTPPGGATEFAADGVRPGGRVGPYRVVREIGRGGMGVVFLAERGDGQFERRVAVKVLRAGVDTGELRRRLVAERQILASLSHPHVAQLLDGGVTDDGRPYLVIEHVDGATITAWCDAARLGVAARLRLFLDVCAAVQHAHQHLVLHRDLKPANVLVAADGQVKLLDFGIAKLLGAAAGGAAGDTPQTRTAHRAMTPAYASPEQVRGDPLTTASDVYALGLLLYELLVGRPAQRLASDAPRAVYEAVCGRDAPRPSDEAVRHDAAPPAELAAARGTTPERLRDALRGDLDAIVAVALRKEPERRYGSVALLAADLGRYLDGRAVLARRGNAAYRAGKLLRRHRVAAVAAAAVLVAVVGGASAALRQARIAERERDRASAALGRAEGALRESQEVAAFLVDLFEANDPARGRVDTLSARDLLLRGEARAARLGAEPVVQARMLEALGGGHANLGDAERAAALVDRALALRRAHLGPRHAETARTMARLADLRQRRGRYAAAESLAVGAWQLRRALLGDAHPDVAASLRQLASLAVYRGDLADAERRMREALAVRRRGVGRGDDSATMRDLQTLASVRWRRGDLAGAEATLREALAVADRALPRANAAAAAVRLRLADRLAERRGGWGEAEGHYRRALADTRAALGDAHPGTAEVMRQVGTALVAHGDPRADGAEGEALLRGALAHARRLHGERHAEVASALAALAEARAARGDLAEAERLARASIPAYAAAWGEHHSTYAGALGNLATLLARRGALDSAEALHRRAVAIRVAALGPEVALVGVTEIALADVLALRGRREAAESLYLHALALIRRQTTDEHPDARRAHAGLAALYASWRRPGGRAALARR